MLWSQGYLRTADVLQKMGKDQTALGIYLYGLRNVSKLSEDSKLLQKSYDKLAEKSIPAKAVDPLQALPLELVEMVLSCLRFEEMVCVFHNVSFVPFRNGLIW